jgi:mannose-6-phosphate isomerase-like protein (cupin superfamily)
MKVFNIDDVSEGFKVLHTEKRSQVAVMILPPGDQSSEEMNVHEKSDQVLLVTEGEVTGEIGEEKKILCDGDFCIVPAGTPHRFRNESNKRAVTFNVYSPPEY